MTAEQAYQLPNGRPYRVDLPEDVQLEERWRSRWQGMIPEGSATFSAQDIVDLEVAREKAEYRMVRMICDASGVAYPFTNVTDCLEERVRLIAACHAAHEELNDAVESLLVRLLTAPSTDRRQR